MAQNTLLIFLSLVVKGRNSWRSGTGQYGGVAFQAELIGLRPQQHMWICGTVRAMAGHTTFFLKRSMLKNERSCCIHVTGGAHCRLRRTGSQIMRKR
jgi:hypothetical protein